MDLDSARTAWVVCPVTESVGWVAGCLQRGWSQGIGRVNGFVGCCTVVVVVKNGGGSLMAV